MVKFDVTLLRFMEDEDFRVLTALEMAHRNHDVAPVVLIERIAQLPHGGCRKRLKELLKQKIIHHENTAYDGYSLKYAAYDLMALRTFSKRGTLQGAGCRIGCGKESDIMLCCDPQGNECVLKLQRLGRCSFRSVSRNRDYKDGKKVRGESWFYLSRLAATKEYAFMTALYDEGFPVPKPIDHNRHAIVMEYVKGTLLNNITDMEVGCAQKVYERVLRLVVKLAQYGLIHGDFNEFNVFVTDDLHIVLIDFPQMVSTSHPNAIDLFDRDVNNLAAFFQRRFKVECALYPKLQTDVTKVEDLDRRIRASGAFSTEDQQALESMMREEADASEDEESDDGDDNKAEKPSGDQDVTASPDKQVAAVLRPHFTDIADLPSSSGADIEAIAGPATSALRPCPVADAENTAATGQEASSAIQATTENAVATSDSEGDDGTATLDASVARNKILRNKNPHFKKDGTVDLAYVREQLKRGGAKESERDFKQNMHRNVTKGRETRRVRRELRSAHEYLD